MLERSSGVLLHISSLPSPFGIGNLGEEAYRFVDQLEAAGIKYWQILPLNPTGPSNSPYASTSCFANNESFIDPRILASEAYLEESELEEFFYAGSPHKVDYAFVFNNQKEYLHRAFSRLNDAQRREMLQFVNAEQFWLRDYAVFSVVHKNSDYAPWQEWEENLNKHEERAISKVLTDETLFQELEYYYFIQWQFRRQWDNLRAYANARNVYIIGDMPIFPALDSADVWSNPEVFQLDKDGWPEAVAGVPPDYFSATGQLWGNPLYDWEALEADEYRWWVKRTQYQMDLFDLVRIDHFRGFDSYWAVPYGSKTAIQGTWRTGPGMKLFETLEKEIEDLAIIAEDLGDINESVVQLIEDTGYPGMKILQFSLDPSYFAKDRPHTFKENCIVYTGTHDNATTYAWLKSQDEESRRLALDYVRMPRDKDWREGGEKSPSVRAFIESIWASPCVMAVVPLQDLLGYGDETRMNTPGTLSQDNWAFRVTRDELQKLDIGWLRYINFVFQRLSYVEPQVEEQNIEELLEDELQEAEPLLDEKEALEELETLADTLASELIEAEAEVAE